MGDDHVLEGHKDELARAVGDIAWRALRLPSEERAGYIWLVLQPICERYAAEQGQLEPPAADELAHHLLQWTEETVRMLLVGRDEGLWEALRDPDPFEGPQH